MFMCAGIHRHTETQGHSLLHFSASYLSQQPTSMSLVISQSLFVSQTNTQMQPLSVWAAAAWANLPMLTGLPHPQLDVAALQRDRVAVCCVDTAGGCGEPD